jgi:Domain of unknown function (DUF4136)
LEFIMKNQGKPSIKTALVAIISVATFFLAGCAGSSSLRSDVQSFAAWNQGQSKAAPPAGASYRFERLPSQQQSEDQSTLEAAARQALAARGLTQGGSDAAYVVQVGVRTIRVDTNTPFNRFGSGGWAGSVFGHPDYIVNRRGQLIWLPRERFEQPYFVRELNLVMRDATNTQVVYETHAKFESLSQPTSDVNAALIAAALDGYPNPPAGQRSVSAAYGNSTVAPK